MGESKTNFVTTMVEDDDFARVLVSPTAPQDGGKSFGLNTQWQHSTSLTGLSYAMYTAHSKPVDYTPFAHERDAVGVFNLYHGQAFADPARGRFAYLQGELGYDDTKLTPKIQDFVHRTITGGRDMAPEYAQSSAREGVNAGVSGLVEQRWNAARIAGVDVMPFLHAGAEIGTDRTAAMGGVGVTIGHHPDGVGRSLAAANPEANAPLFVRDPAQAKGGDWAVTAHLDQYAIGTNRFLKGAVEPNRAPLRAAIEAAVAVSDRVTLHAGYDISDNPAQRLANISEQGPTHNQNARVGLTWRF